MADLDHNPWVITHADVGTISTGLVSAQTLRWIGATTAGHQCILKDTAGNVVWEAVAAGANNEEESTSQRRPFSSDTWIGLVVDKLDSGTLYIYLM